MSPRVFASFAGRDRSTIARFIARLKAQPIDLWDYSEEGQEIPGGEPIGDVLRNRIACCEYFLALVTPASLENTWTRLEVTCALEKQQAADEQEGFRLIPIFVEQLERKEVPEPYASLRRLRYYDAVDLTDAVAVERILQRCCADMRVRFAPLTSEDPRLPFLDRLWKEIHTRVPRDERYLSVAARIQEAASNFQEQHAKGDLASAQSAISFLIATCEYEFSSERFYFPYIAKAVVALGLGRLQEALDAVEPVRNHPDRDENFFGVVGFVMFQQGHYQDAARYYAEAVRRDPTDPAARAWLLKCSSEAGLAVDPAQVLEGVDRSKLVSHGEQAVLARLEAAMLSRLGRRKDAIQCFERLPQPLDPDSAVELARLLLDPTVATPAEARRARSLLEETCRQHPQHGGVLHELAATSFQLGEREAARRHFEALVERHAGNTLYASDAIQCAWACGQRQQARALATKLLGMLAGRPLGSPDEHYRAGLANWVLGRRERADYDFERSGYAPELSYDRIMPA